MQIAIISVLCHEKGILEQKKKKKKQCLIPTKRLVAGVQKDLFFSQQLHIPSPPPPHKNQLEEL